MTRVFRPCLLRRVHQGQDKNSLALVDVQQTALITAVITHGTGVALEVGLAAAGIGLGVLGAWFMTVCHRLSTHKPVSRPVTMILTRTIAARAGHLPALTPDGNLRAPQAA